MAQLTFVANGLLNSDAIKFYPRDDAGNYIENVQLALTGTNCSGASISNVRSTTDDSGAQCLVADFTSATSVPNGTCTVVATAPDGTTCGCDLDFTGQLIQCPTFDTGAACKPGDTFQGALVLVDQNGDPYVGEVDAELTGNAQLQSMGSAPNWNFTAVAGQQAGDIEMILTGPGLNNCRFLVKVIEANASIDCSSIQANVPITFEVGETRAVSFTVLDTDGNPITSGLNITGNNSNVENPQFVNGDWRLFYTPNATTSNVVIDFGGEACGITINAVNPREVDCSSLVPRFTNYTIDEAGAVFFTVNDADGVPITDGLSFSGVGTEIANAIFTDGEWRIAVRPGATQFQILINDSDCVINANATGATVVDCANVTCEVIGGQLVVGRPGRFVVRVVDEGGSPISTGVQFDLTGATLDAEAYSNTLGGWVLDITPTSTNVNGSLLTSAFGNCADFCDVTAIDVEIDCASVGCAVLSGSFEIGQRETIAVTVRDTTGAPITSGAQFAFNGADIENTPTYSASIGAWVIEITPTSETVVGSQVTTPFGICNNFCSIDTEVVQSCCPNISALNIPTAFIGTLYAGQFLADGVQAEITGLPSGIIYNPATGVISGTSIEEGESSIVINYGSCSITVPFIVAATPVSQNDCCPKLVNISAPTGIVGDPYAGFAVFSGVGARSYGATGLPPGLVVNPQTGQYTGTPTETGNFVSTLIVTDSRGSCTYSVTFDVDTANEDCPAIPPKINRIPSLVGTIDTPVSSQFFGSSGATFDPIELGNGLSINEFGELEGTPTNAGTTAFELVMRDSESECRLNLSYTVLGATGSATGDDAITSISTCVCKDKKMFFVLGGTTTDFVVEGDMPEGVSFSGGALVGTPTTVGSYKFDLTPGNGATISMMVNVEDCDMPAPATPTEPEVMQEQAFWIKLIGCVSIEGIDYNASYDKPTNPLRVTEEQFRYLLANGLGVACMNGESK